jgi:hypothetical protein
MKTVVRKRHNCKSTVQPGFASIFSYSHEAGSFTFKVGDVSIQTSAKFARRLFYFMRHHFEN